MTKIDLRMGSYNLSMGTVIKAVGWKLATTYFNQNKDQRLADSFHSNFHSKGDIFKIGTVRAITSLEL